MNTGISSSEGHPSPPPLPTSRPSTVRTIVFHCIWLSALYFTILFTFVRVVPAFEKIFKDFDVELPQPTLLTLTASYFIVSNWFLTIPLWLGSMGICAVLYQTGFRRASFAVNILLTTAAFLILTFIGLSLYLPHVALMQNLQPR